MRTDLHLHVERTGHGPPVLLLHADVATGAAAWMRQRPLAERWELVVPDRPGYGRSGPVDRVDFAVEAGQLAPLLGAGGHLVGHSYGGVVALLLAAAHPRQVRSLTVVEPPAFSVAPAHPDVAALLAALRDLWDDPPDDADRFFARFAELMGERSWPRPPMPPQMERGVRRLIGERPPWEAVIDTGALRDAPFPMLVVSGGHSPALEALCDALAELTHARRKVVQGAKHAVPRTGEPFNAVLERFLESAEFRQ